MLPNGELHVLAVRQGDENHLYHCRVLVRPNGQTMTSTTAGRMLLLSGRKIFLSSTNKNEFLLYQLIFKNLIALKDTMTKTAPVIVESVNRVRVWRGQDAVLPCVFQGYPPPKIKSVSIFLFFLCRPFRCLRVSLCSSTTCLDSWQTSFGPQRGQTSCQLVSSNSQVGIFLLRDKLGHLHQPP